MWFLYHVNGINLERTMSERSNWVCCWLATKGRSFIWQSHFECVNKPHQINNLHFDWSERGQWMKRMNGSHVNVECLKMILLPRIKCDDLCQLSVCPKWTFSSPKMMFIYISRMRADCSMESPHMSSNSQQRRTKHKATLQNENQFW